MTRVPTWAAQRDPIINDQAKRAARHAAITQIWGGDVTQVWADILHTGGQRPLLIPSFIEYLRHT